tara:strand:- start:58 stop:501 length:444 start_codon:yes stop_codon:yes gene_type:complete
MKFLRRNLIVASTALILNAIWEYVVCAYFYDNDIVFNMSELMVEATLGDVAVTLLFFNLIMLIKKDETWNFEVYDYLNTAIYGVAAAFYFESSALNVNRWAYSEAMLTIGKSGVGLLPVLQFIILIPLAIYFERVVQVIFENKRSTN